MESLWGWILVVAIFWGAPAVFSQESDQLADPSSCDATVNGVEHADALADACRFALSLRQKLPNVICDQKTSRYNRPDGNLYREKLQDVITAEVIYEDGYERYSDVKVNGKAAAQDANNFVGQYTKGEFGSDLIFAFSPQNHPSYKFLRKDHVSGHKAFVFAAVVARENNHGWSIGANSRRTYPQFEAEIWLDQVSHELLREVIKPVPEPRFPVSNAKVRTDYQLLPLGDGSSFVLPVKSESESCLWDDEKRYIMFCSSNVLVFQNCHKFGVKSRIVTDEPKEVK